MAQTTKTKAELNQAALALEDWLDLQVADQAFEEMDGDDLCEISALALADAPEAELIEAVKRAKDEGWTWAPIGMAIGLTRREVIERFGRAIGHPAIPRQRRG
ncbi:MAG TPA: hypothetical protein VGH89_39870 [Pseudonocardia sp.]|jgi:hypothetical protein